MKKESSESSEQQEPELPLVPFREWNLSPSLLKGLDEIGYTEPTRVQNAVFPIAAQGKDLMVQSHTGSGKTAAFGIPIVNKIDIDKKAPQALILAPTRELALQVSRELSRIAEFHSASVIPIYGGAPINKQIDQLEAGAQIIAGTPGRVMDHLKRGTLNPSDITHLVLDECDEMLSMGFQEDIETIVKQLPKPPTRQTFLFSATIPPAIERLGKRFMQEYEMIQLSSDSVGVDLIDHYYYVVTGIARPKNLYHILCSTKPESAIIFCNTREETTTVAKYLTKRGYKAAAINSDLSQKERERVLSEKRDGTLRFLVATDIAARGIDISDLSHVINYTFPESAEVYIHRTGRTGRAGKDGVAISLIGPKDIGSFYNLKLIYKILPDERELPTSEEIAAFEANAKKRELFIELRSLEAPDEKNLAAAKNLLLETDSETLVATLLSQFAWAKKQEKKRASRPRPEAKNLDDSTSQEAADDNPSGKKRRRRPRSAPKGRSRSQERTEQTDDKETPADVETKSEKTNDSSKRNTRSKTRSKERRPPTRDRKPAPKTNPDGNVEFWEAWADDKPAKAKESSVDTVQKQDSKSTDDPSAAKPLSEENTTTEVPRKKRRRRRRPQE